MKQPRDYKNLEKKLRGQMWIDNFKDIKKIADSEYTPILLRQKLYRKLWPLNYSAIPKKLLDRYQVVLKKLGSLNKKSLKQFIDFEFYHLDDLEEKINSWEAIADTLEFYSQEKGFSSYKQRSEVYNVLFFATWYPTKHILSLWKLLDDKDGYSMSSKEITGIIKYYKKILKKK